MSFVHPVRFAGVFTRARSYERDRRLLDVYSDFRDGVFTVRHEHDVRGSLRERLARHGNDSVSFFS